MNAKKIVLTTLSAALIAGAAIPAFAAPHDGPGRHGGPDGPGGPRGGMMMDMVFIRLLQNADTNKDGKISKEEMAAREDALFTAIDTNKDGAITRGELVDYRDAKRAEWMKDHPRPERDGKEHADKGPDKGPDRGPDGGKDHKRADRGPDHGWRDHDRRDAHFDGPRHGPGGGMMGMRMFRMIDENRDGKIEKAEAVAASDKLFERMDTNKDGQITIDDLPNRPL